MRISLHEMHVAIEWPDIWRICPSRRLRPCCGVGARPRRLYGGHRPFRRLSIAPLLNYWSKQPSIAPLLEQSTQYSTRAWWMMAEGLSSRCGLRFGAAVLRPRPILEASALRGLVGPDCSPVLEHGSLGACAPRTLRPPRICDPTRNSPEGRSTRPPRPVDASRARPRHPERRPS